MLKYLAILLFAVSASAQSATTTYNGTSVVTVVTDAAANTYTVTTPLSVSVGSPVLVFNPPPPPPPPVGPSAPVIPSTATVVDLLPQTWKACVHDAGTPGTATCSGSFPVTDAVTSANSRSFSMTYTGAGGVRWADSFARDTAATNFVLAVDVMAPDWTKVANLELDTNQTKANGHTAILGTQCSSYGHSWEVTLMNPGGTWSWYTTNLTCDPTKWTPNVLHHIRIFGTIDASEVATYIGVEFDGSYGAFSGATGMTGRALGWSVGSNLMNFQIDGLSTSGSATIYADRITEYRW